MPEKPRASAKIGLPAQLRVAKNGPTEKLFGTKLAVALATGPIQIYDLRRIRQALAAMNLDWKLSP